jgi:hypothetical protein
MPRRNPNFSRRTSKAYPPQDQNSRTTMGNMSNNAAWQNGPNNPRSMSLASNESMTGVEINDEVATAGMRPYGFHVDNHPPFVDGTRAVYPSTLPVVRIEGVSNTPHSLTLSTTKSL